MVMLAAFTFWFPLLLLAKAKIHGKSFEPRVEWMCAESAIEVLMHTKEPFYGRIQPKGTNSCSVKGNGDNINRMIIPLDGDGGTQWRDCGLHLENGSSTLWTQLEVHQHPMLILQHDKLINVSCSHQWSDSLERHEEADNPYRLVFRPAEPQSMEEMSPVNRLQFGASYKLLLFGPPPQGQLRIHSCNATSIDRSLAVQLIDSDGCSLDPNLLMSAFNSPSQTGGPVPDNSSSQQANSSSATPPPPPSQQHRIAVATARVPSMFRFNTQQQQQTSTATNPPNAVDLVRFECSVEPCGQRGQQPCQPKPDCDSRRVVARQKTVEKEPATEGAAGDLELVTHLLGSGDNETKDDIGAELNTSLTGDIPTKSSTNEPGDSGIIGAGGWHRVRTVVRVLEGNSRGSAAHLNAGRTGGTNEQQTSAAPPTMSTTISSVEPGTKEEALSPQQRALESGIDPFLSNNSSSSASAAHSAPSPLLRDFSGTSVFPPPPPPSLLPRPSNHTSSSSTCISADQLLRLYQLGVGLCALFLLGCFCNLLLCCLHSRRRNPKSQSPLRSKRGRREHVLISNGPTSQSTLNSSLYGPTGQATQKGAKVGPREEGTGFWISGDGGRENCVDIGEHSILSSIYGALPVQPQPIAAPLPNNTSNRRSSVHSYASVKAPHSVQHRGGGGHHLLNPRINQQQPQEHELVQRQQVVNLSPTHSPSTTTSSGGNFHLSRTFQPHLPLSQLDMQNQASNSLASSSSVRSSTLGTPSPSETDPTNSSTPRPSSDLLHRQQEDGTSNNQPQSSTFGGANFLTTTTVPSLKGQCQQQQQIESLSIL